MPFKLREKSIKFDKKIWDFLTVEVCFMWPFTSPKFHDSRQAFQSEASAREGRGQLLPPLNYETIKMSSFLIPCTRFKKKNSNMFSNFWPKIEKFRVFEVLKLEIYQTRSLRFRINAVNKNLYRSKHLCLKPFALWFVFKRNIFCFNKSNI